MLANYSVKRLMISEGLGKHILLIALAMLCITCGPVRAWEPPPALPKSQLAVQVRTHQFICKSISAEFVLRSDWQTKTGPQNLRFISAKFNGHAVKLPPDLLDIFDYFFETKEIFGECVEQSESESVGVAMIAITKFKELPDVRLYFDITASEVKFLELVCGVDERPQGVPESMFKYCVLKK